jgi:hypothetical protein
MDAREYSKPYAGFAGAEIKVTVDHGTIRRWAESRHGRPVACTARHRRPEAGTLRIEFADRQVPESFRELSWVDFFEAFDRSRQAFLYEDAVEDGIESRFYRFVRRDGGEARG